MLASVNQIPIPAGFDRILESMLQALSILAQGGTAPQLGDDDGGRLFDASRNRRAHLLDPLATGAVLFGRGDFKTLAGGPREETLWLLGEAGIEEFDRIPAVEPAGSSFGFRASGLYVMKGDDPTRRLVIDAGPQGAHTAGHGHADALSLTAISGDCDLLIDSGTFAYVEANGERNRFRGTRAHNTLVVAGEDQAEAKGPFNWGRLPKVQAESWLVGKTFDLFAGTHNGYSRLPNAVVHRRTVFSLKSGFWLVRDQALGFGECQLDLLWHLASGLKTVAGQERLFLRDGSGLRFITVEGNGWTESIEEQPNSPVYGKRENHEVLRFSTRAQLPTEFVTLMLPAADAIFSESKLTKIAPSPTALSSVAGYRYKTAEGEHHFFFGPGKPWKLDPWSSDAEFLYFGPTAESGTQILICCNATYVEWSDVSIVTAKRPLLHCETIGSSIEFEIVSSDPESVIVNRQGWRALVANGNPEPAGKLTLEEKS